MTSLEDSRKTIAQTQYYHGITTSDSNALAIRGKIEAPYAINFELECVFNTPLGDYPYLKQ